MTEELVDAFGRRITALTLIPSSGGRFEVTLNGTLVFSKANLQRKPHAGEVVTLVKAVEHSEEKE